jgi:hypothetical protein
MAWLSRGQCQFNWNAVCNIVISYEIIEVPARRIAQPGKYANQRVLMINGFLLDPVDKLTSV